MNSFSFGLFAVKTWGSLTSVPQLQIPTFANSPVNPLREMKRKGNFGTGETIGRVDTGQGDQIL